MHSGLAYTMERSARVCGGMSALLLVAPRPTALPVPMRVMGGEWEAAVLAGPGLLCAAGPTS